MGDKSKLVELLTCIDPDRMAEKMGERDVDELAAMLEAGPLGPELEEDTMEEDTHAQNGCVSKEPHGLEAEKGVSVDIAMVSEISVPIDIASKTMLPTKSNGDTIANKMLEGDAADLDTASEEDQAPAVRTASKRFVELVRAGDKQALEDMFMEASTDDIWNGFMDMQIWLEPAEVKMVEKQFDRLIPSRDFARMLRQRPDLKAVVTKMAKHKVHSMMKLRRK